MVDNLKIKATIDYNLADDYKTMICQILRKENKLVTSQNIKLYLQELLRKELVENKEEYYLKNKVSEAIERDYFFLKLP